MKFRCPICGREIKMPGPKSDKDETGMDFFPFCSQRCKLLDLGAWFDGQYRIAEPPEDALRRDSSREKKDSED